MTGMLANADWLNFPETRAVMTALDAAGLGDSRFVGGCVRNTLMGRSVDDIDIATQLLPEETVAALEAAGLRAVPTGIEHGTVTAVVDSMPFEITSLRRDVETDGRRAVVAFTRDWGEDALRRDFRLNAIYADLDGVLHDPTEGGIKDAASGRVIFIGNADERLREDYLRILRFFRFNAWYGADIDAEGLAACARHKDGLKQIAAERIWKELKKLLSAPDPQDAVAEMVQTGILQAILPNAASPEKLPHRIRAEAHFDLPPDPLGRLITILDPIEDQDIETARHLKLSNAERDRITHYLRASRRSVTPTDTLAKDFYRYGEQAVIDCAIDQYGRPDLFDQLDAVLSFAKTWQRPDFPLRGADLVKAGLPPGPLIGDTLRDLEQFWIESDFQMDRTALLNELERRLKAD